MPHRPSDASEDEDEEASGNFEVLNEAAGGCAVEKLKERLELPMGLETGLEGSN